MLHIAAPRRDENGVPFKREAEIQKYLSHGGFVYIRAEQRVYLLRLELDGGGCQGSGHNVDHTLHDLARAEHLHQLARTLNGGVGVLDVQPLLKARRRIRAHAERGCSAPDGGAVEIRALEEHHGGVADDLAVLAAHYARHGDGLIGVADAQHARREPALRSVKRADALALAGAAHVYLVIAYACKVERMHRLTVLEHDIVCDIDNIVYRAHAGVADTLAHPLRAGGDLHVFDHSRGVARAEIRLVDEYPGKLVYVSARLRLDDRLMQLQLLAERHRRLARETYHAQTVRAVGSYLKFNDVIVHADERADVVAGLAVLMQHEDAVGDAVGELLLLCVQVGKGADPAACVVIGDHIPDVDILAVAYGLPDAAAAVKLDLPEVYAVLLHIRHLRGDDRAEYLVAGGNVRRDGRLLRVNGMVVAKYGGGLYLAVGVVVRRQPKLPERAEHTVRLHAAQLAARDLRPVGEKGVMKRRGHKIAHMDVPCACADLHRLFSPGVYLCHEHMVGIGVLFYRENAPDPDVSDFAAQILRDLYLRAGNGHRLGKGAVVILINGQLNELVEPFS